VPEPGDLPTNRSGGRRTPVLLAIKGLGHGGAERLLVDSVRNGDHRAYQYEVAYVLAASDDLAGELAGAGIPVHALGADRSLDLRWLWSFRRLLLDRQYAIVHFHLPYTAALGRLVVLTLPRRRRPVTVYTEHSLWTKVSPLVKLLNRATASRDSALIAVSDAAQRDLPRALRGRARVVVHGVDLGPSRAMVAGRPGIRARIRAELGVADGELLAVTVANLRSEKGYDVLLEAARRIGGRGLPVHFVAAGQGDQAAALEERRHVLGLDDRLRFLGHRTDALALLTAADLVVLPSHQEGLPVVLMEATTVGATIVATSVGGVPQVITDGVNGLLVPPGDPDALANAVARLVDDPALADRLGRAAREGGASFDVARASAEIEALYAELLTPPG
jgi:glycosyltransferase involved in cell wall biosynthesis